MHEILLAPSILAGNHANLAASAKLVEDCHLKWIHLDIMDGHFVPNLTFGPDTVKALRKESKLYFDTHLMLDNPHLFIDAFAQAGSNNITIHIEPNYLVKETLLKIKDLGIDCGISLNPGTPIESIVELLNIVDVVLIMTVQPGFGGQSFREDMLQKIDYIHKLREENNYKFRIEVDGGINLETAKLCKERGVDTFVAGTAFYKANDPHQFAKDICS